VIILSSIISAVDRAFMNFMVAPCINYIKYFIFQLMHTIIKSLDY
jgi:hypothetical protein